MPDPQLVIFDCDGVLVDSEIIAARVEAELLTAAGFPIEAEELAERYAGLTFKDILLRIEKEADIPLQASLVAQAETLVDRRLAAEVRMIEGASEAVAATRTPRAICSNSSRHRVNAMLERTSLKSFFADAVIFPSDETPTKLPKPAPDVYLHAAKTLDADPAAVFVIEDSRHGVAAAKAAGMRVIGFTGAAHSAPGHADALTEAGAETVIRRFAELHPTMAALSAWSED